MAFAVGLPARQPGSFRSRTGTVGNWSTESPDEFDWSGDEDGEFPVSRLRQQYVDYLATKVLEYEEQKVARHYYHGAQWTPEEIRILRARRQPIITFNRTSRKVDGIVGLVQRLRQDPKAFPRNPQNGTGAEVVTQSVRAVLDGADWEYLDFECCKQAAIEGVAGIELKLVEGDHQDPDVTADFIFGDDFFYDPRSFKPDFSDARYMGIAKWLDVDAAVELFPDKEDELRTLMVDTGFDLTTHSDREFKWVYVNEQRLRLVEHWYKHKGRWHWAFYCSFMLLARGTSPFLDERNRPCNKFVMFSASVDHDGDRYGFPRNLKGPQDELNQRRSKALHMANTRRLIAHKGAVDDVEIARREWARPDGYIEVNPGREIKPDDTTMDQKAQLDLMADARSEIDSFASITPDRLGADDASAHSGVAINLLQKAGLAELGSFIKYYENWTLRVYRAVWNVVRSTWKAERWIRVNVGNEEAVSWIQLNGIGVDQWGRPTWVNKIGALNVDIILDKGPDTANVLLDVLDVLKTMPPGTVPPQIFIKLAPISESIKKELLQLMQQASQQQQQQDPQAQLAQVKIATEKIKAGVAQQKGQAEVQRENMSVQGDQIRARQEAVGRAQDAAIERERMQAERQRIFLERQQSDEAHVYKMAEIREAFRAKIEERKARAAEMRRRPQRVAGGRR